MAIFFACLLAGISTVAFLILWFRMVWQELHAKQKTVNAAKSQLVASKQSCLRVRDGPPKKQKQAQAIMQRSEWVYQQSVQLYNESLHKPWNLLPGKLMGFHSIKKSLE